jgi:spermidine synthase
VLVVLGIVLAGWGGVRHDRKQHAGAQVKFYGNSNYGMLQVLDLGSTRYYLNDWLVQNTYDPATGQSTSEFTYMLHGLAQAYTSNINHALAIGLGVGIVPMQFVADGAKVDVVEINPSVVPLGVQYFGLQPDKMNLAIADGREFLNNAPTDLYDTIALDAFLGESSPSHLMTREAFLQMQRVLRPGGTLVINSFGSFEAGEDFFTTSLYRTLTNVFASVRIHTSGRNIYFVASDREPLAMVNAPLVEHVHSVARADVEAAYAGLVEPGTEVRGHAFDPSRGRVLTDDFNPVDFFDAPNRELIRRELALNWRRRQ